MASSNYFVTETDGPVIDTDSTGFIGGIAQSVGFARAESMEIQNDPRFIHGNVINKRLAAFGKLSIVSGLMLGTSMGQLFALKKNMDFSKFEMPVGPIGWIQFTGFCCQMTVTFMCIIALYTICHQLFYTYRLMTAGPTGFEMASMFYLTKSIVMWRHFAIKCLLNGLSLFLFSAGITMYVKFIKDASSSPKKIIILNVNGGTSTDNMIPVGLDIKSPLDQKVHTMLAYVVLVCFISIAGLLYTIRKHHLQAFRDFYVTAKDNAKPLTQTLLQMSHRNKMASPDT